MIETLTTISVEKKKAILDISLDGANLKREEYEVKIRGLKAQEEVFKGIYGAFKKEKEQLKHSLYYYENLLAEANQTIEEINMWKKELC